MKTTNVVESPSGRRVCGTSPEPFRVFGCSSEETKFIMRTSRLTKIRRRRKVYGKSRVILRMTSRCSGVVKSPVKIFCLAKAPRLGRFCGKGRYPLGISPRSSKE